MRYLVGNKLVELSDNALKIIESYIQNNNKKLEAGGILLGEVWEDNSIHVTDVSIPNVFDKASRYNFNRDVTAAQIIVNHEFANSKGMCIYLGEWHTHSENIPKPSGQDKLMIKEQFEKGLLNEDFLLLVIQGQKGRYVALYDGKKLRKVKQ